MEPDIMISFGSPTWLIPAAVVALIGVIAVVIAARRGHAPQRIRMAAGALKVFGLSLLAMCLIEPVWSGVQPKPHSNLFLALADNSGSLTSGEQADGKTVAEQIAQVAKEQPQPENWQKRLEQDFELHRFAFDRRLRHVSAFDELDWNGGASSLKAALSSIGQRFQGRPLGGIVLLTDGQATDLTTAELQATLKQLGDVPIYPVRFVEPDAMLDLAIQSVSVSQTPFEDSPVSIQCDVAVRGIQHAHDEYEGDLLAVCHLLNDDGETVKTERLPLGTDTSTLPFRLQFRPVATGVAPYRLRVELQAFEGMKEAVLDEATLANNARIVQIDRGSEKQRVLYVCGRPNWEFKFLRRALDEDEQVDLVGMIRVARREAKFDFRGRDAQSSNSIFRGFKNETDEETERYDQPVIVRLNTKDANELRGGFPKKADELFAYDAIILDDIEAGFFKHEQLALIEKFVSERGGGLLMLGGAECFEAGGYNRTPVADALPVYLDKAVYPDNELGLALDLTREGWLQPWVRLRPNEADEKQRLAEMPTFKTLNPSEGIKPGATVLATVSDADGHRWPALVTQKYGHGRVGAMLIGDLWRWQIRRTDEHPDDLAKSWRQTVRWLLADVPGRVSLRSEPAPDIAPEAVRIHVRVTDEDFRSLDNARVAIKVSGPVTGGSFDHDSFQRSALERTDGRSASRESSNSVEHASDEGRDAERPDGRSHAERGNELVESAASARAEIVLDAEASLDEPGVYSAVFVPKEAGAWNFAAEVITSDGDSLPSAETGWVYEPAVEEFQATGINTELLNALASESGGEVIDADELDEFVAGLQSRPMPVMEAWTMPLWDQPLVFLIVLCCLLGEWGLRRSKGLP
jgi:uncharacterized membrane protein